ncbi:MAG: beta-N-acetylhexosaminidase [Betaproteobacteria bacterium]|nr:beta-N-acetylhexosaminidase [Betaproteobacteria bacterium]
MNLPPGPLMIDIAGCALCDLDRERLCHPSVGGIILFSRNYRDPEQLAALTDEIHALRAPPLLIAVDHEGGRVQRFREGFTRLPPMRALGTLHDRDPAAALSAATDTGYVLAAELRACGVDYSFTPVLDLDYGPSRVIGDRAFHRQAEVVSVLAASMIDGLAEGGMGACGKHYPGHGYVIPDSHVDLPVDARTLAEMADDMLPYRRLSLAGVMAAHVIYECFDCNTAVFSNKWIRYLRENINFGGVVFTDDLSMAGAGVAGDMPARVAAAETAGCDMLLVCNAPDDVARVLAEWQPKQDAARAARISALLPTARAPSLAALRELPRYREALATLARLGA